MASASQADLPAPWEQHEDDEGQVYYWNSETGEASWVHPADKADDLPFGWEELEDDSGNKYYFNHETGESQWHKPADQDPELVSLNTNLPEGWEALRDDDENVYYFNFTTEESTWDRPADAGPPGEIKAEDTTAAVAAAAEAAAKGAVLPDRKAARRHSVAKAMILQSKRAPRMLMPMMALAEGGEEEGEEGDAAKPAATGPSPKEQAANRKASMLAKESIVTDAAVKVWLKVSDNGKFWRRRFCTYIPEARSIFLYLSEKTKSKKGIIDLVGAKVLEEAPGVDLDKAPTPYVFAVEEPERPDAPAKTTLFCAPTVSASAQMLGALASSNSGARSGSLAKVKGLPAIGGKRKD